MIQHIRETQTIQQQDTTQHTIQIHDQIRHGQLHGNTQNQTNAKHAKQSPLTNRQQTQKTKTQTYSRVDILQGKTRHGTQRHTTKIQCTNKHNQHNTTTYNNNRQHINKHTQHKTN